MISRGHHTTIVIISMFLLLLLENLLFVVTCTLKNKLTTWLCLIKGYLANVPRFG
jgi:hypothetical protein